jgi:membrane-associated phospholipid phosphatase
VIAEVMPERANAVLARGLRYGQNRVVCGVHHPSDVEQGRLLAIAIFAKIKATPAFAADLACAVEEYRKGLGGDQKGPLSAGCQAMSDAYRKELGA